MPIMDPLNAAALLLGRRWRASRRRYAVLCAKRCGATWPTRAGRSRRKPNTGSPVAGASGRTGGAGAEEGSRRPEKLSELTLRPAMRQVRRADERSIIRHLPHPDLVSAGFASLTRPTPALPLRPSPTTPFNEVYDDATLL